MIELLSKLREHFDPLEDRLRMFSRYEFQCEGWFKGEMVAFLHGALTKSLVSAFDREVKTPSGRQVDLSVELGRRRHWVELKHWYIGEQRGTAWRAPDYFGTRSSFGLISDVEKLLLMPEQDGLWMLVFATPNPGIDEWRAGIDRFHDKFPAHRLQTHSGPAGFPDWYCFDLLEVSRESVGPAG